MEGVKSSSLLLNHRKSSYNETSPTSFPLHPDSKYLYLISSVLILIFCQYFRPPNPILKKTKQGYLCRMYIVLYKGEPQMGLNL